MRRDLADGELNSLSSKSILAVFNVRAETLINDFTLFLGRR